MFQKSWLQACFLALILVSINSQTGSTSLLTRLGVLKPLEPETANFTQIQYCGMLPSTERYGKITYRCHALYAYLEPKCLKIVNIAKRAEAIPVRINRENFINDTLFGYPIKYDYFHVYDLFNILTVATHIHKFFPIENLSMILEGADIPTEQLKFIDKIIFLAIVTLLCATMMNFIFTLIRQKKSTIIVFVWIVYKLASAGVIQTMHARLLILSGKVSAILMVGAVLLLLLVVCVLFGIYFRIGVLITTLLLSLSKLYVLYLNHIKKMDVLNSFPKDCYQVIREGNPIYLELLSEAYQGGYCTYTIRGFLKHHYISNMHIYLLQMLLFVAMIFVSYYLSKLSYGMLLVTLVSPKYNTFNLLCSVYEFGDFRLFGDVRLYYHINSYVSAREFINNLRLRYHRIAPTQILQLPKFTHRNRIIRDNGCHSIQAHTRSKYYGWVITQFSELFNYNKHYFNHRNVSNAPITSLRDCKSNTTTSFLPTGKKHVFLLDNFQNLANDELLYLYEHNEQIISYHPIPTAKTSKIVTRTSGHMLKVTTDISGGDRMVDSFDMNRYKETFVLTNGFTTAVITQKILNLGDHHVISISHCTYFGPAMLLNDIAAPEKHTTTTTIYLNYKNSLVLSQTNYAVVDSKVATYLQNRVNYDSTSTSLNLANQNEEKQINLKSYFEQSVLATIVKETGRIEVFDCRWPNPFMEQEEPEPTATVVNSTKMPSPITDVLQVDNQPIASSRSNPEVDKQKDPITVSGPIKASKPNTDSASSLIAYLSRYVFAPVPNLTFIKSLDLPGLMQSFVDTLAETYVINKGSLFKNKDLMKVKHVITEQDARSMLDHNLTSMNLVENFTKWELYADAVKVFRMISNSNKLLVAKFTPFTAVLQKVFAKNIDWYAPGKNKYKIEVTIDTAGIDYSKYEATQSLFMRMIELFVSQLFTNDDAKEFRELIVEEYNSQFKFDTRNKGFKKLHAKDKVKMMFISALAKRLSGSALTTLMNTMIAGFLQFLFYVVVKNYSATKAMASIRLCYGDDGLIIAKFITEFAAFASKLGFKVTLEPNYEPTAKMFCGKVISDEGKLSTDCIRHINKFLGATGSTGNDSNNMLLKWGGFYADFVGKGGNTAGICYLPFELIGQYSGKLISDDGKLQEKFNDFMVTRANNNVSTSAPSTLSVTYDMVFGSELKQVCENIAIAISRKPSKEKFVADVAGIILPFISNIYDTSDPPNAKIYVDNICVKDYVNKSKIKLSTALSHVTAFNYGVGLVNKILEKDQFKVKFVKAEIYLNDLRTCLEHVEFVYSDDVKPQLVNNNPSEKNAVRPGTEFYNNKNKNQTNNNEQQKQQQNKERKRSNHGQKRSKKQFSKAQQ